MNSALDLVIRIGTRGANVDRRVLDRYPETLRAAYRSVLQERSSALKHSALIELADSSLEFLTSVIFSAYRNQSWSFPSRDVEGFVSDLHNLTFRKSFELLRLTFAQLDQPIFDLGDTELPANQHFAQAVAGIAEAIELDVSNIRRLVEARFSTTPSKVSWFQAYGNLVNYRNRCEGHSRSHKWPVGHADYYALMTPLLESAVLELITSPGIADYLLRTCTGTIVSKDGPTASGGYLFDVEYQGIPQRVAGTLDDTRSAAFPECEWSTVDPRLYLLSSRSNDAIEPKPEESFIIEGQFHDFSRHGLPKPLIVLSEIPPAGRASSPSTTQNVLKGRASAAGTCGELIQGILPDGRDFHVTCPVNKSSTVAVELSQASAWAFTGSGPHLGKLHASIKAAAEIFGLGPLSVELDHHTDLDVGKGLGSSTADIVAGARAVAAAAGGTLTPRQLATIATAIEPSDGSMYPGLIAFNQKNAEIVRAFEWWPQFAIVMVVPRDTLNTESADFQGKERYAVEFAGMLEELVEAASNHDPLPFARAATRSALINQEFIPNEWLDVLLERVEASGGAGVNVGHSGTVTGMLFPLSHVGSSPKSKTRSSAMARATGAARSLSQLGGQGVEVRLVTTPAWKGAASAI